MTWDLEAVSLIEKYEELRTKYRRLEKEHKELQVEHSRVLFDMDAVIEHEVSERSKSKKEKKKEKSELERITGCLFWLWYWVKTLWGAIKIRVDVRCEESISPIECWRWSVYIWDGKSLIYQTDILDFEDCLHNVRDYITNNFKTELN